MANMSYCRFQNTLSDLQDCAEAIFQREPVSGEERYARAKLIKECVAILQDLGVTVEDSEVDQCIESLDRVDDEE